MGLKSWQLELPGSLQFLDRAANCRQRRKLMVLKILTVAALRPPGTYPQKLIKTHPKEPTSNFIQF